MQLLTEYSARKKVRSKTKKNQIFIALSPGHVLDVASFSFGDEVQPAQEAVDGLVDVFLWDFSPCPLRRLQLAERGERVSSSSIEALPELPPDMIVERVDNVRSTQQNC